MQKHIQVFNNTEFGEIRTMEINGEPWFVGKKEKIGEIVRAERER